MTAHAPGEPLVVWLSEVGVGSVDLVGGKCASLGELTRAGAPVPDGFAVTTHAHRSYLDQSGIEEVARDALTGLDYHDVAAVQAASDRIRAAIEATPIAAAVEEAMLAHYGELMDRSGGAAPVAVRSSATAEDLRSASFAGQLETFLWIQQAGEMVRHTLLCWAGMYTPQALSYRHHVGAGSGRALMSVAVQQMVDARSAGVMFTINPVNGDRSKVMVESVWGLGEGIVKGEVNPDRYLIDKVTMAVSERHVAVKETEYRFQPAAGVVAAPVSKDRQAQPSVTDSELIELLKHARQIERHYGRPQDIEWAIGSRPGSDDRVHILQSRDETVWSQKTAPAAPAPGRSAIDHVVAKMTGVTR